MSSTGRGVVELVALVDTSVLLAGGSETSGLSVLVHGVADPVDSSIVSNGNVGGIDQDDLKVLVGGVLVDPVGVEDSQVAGSSANSLLGNSSQRSLQLELVDTLVGGLTVGGSLLGGSLSVSSSDSDSVDDKALLGLVAESSSLVGSRGSRSSVDTGLLSVLPASDSEQESEHVRLLLSVDFLKVLVGAHCCCVGELRDGKRYFTWVLGVGRVGLGRGLGEVGLRELGLHVT